MEQRLIDANLIPYDDNGNTNRFAIGIVPHRRCRSGCPMRGVQAFISCISVRVFVPKNSHAYLFEGNRLLQLRRTEKNRLWCRPMTDDFIMHHTVQGGEKMIKNFSPQPFDGYNPLPSYVSSVDKHVLIGTVPGDYKITLAKLTVGTSMSAGNPLAHALFESYTDHGEQAKVARTRVSGYDREFIAVRSAMNETGVELHPALPCPCEAILESLGEWFKVQNLEITEVSVVSQTCH